MSERKGIIGAGNWLVDNIKYIDRWAGEGNLANILGQERATGGGPANVLFDLAAMDCGIPLYAAGRIGRDALGDYLLEEIKKRSIDASNIIFTDTPTSYSDVMSGNGKRSFFCCRGANAEFDCTDVENITFPAKWFYLGYLLLLDKLDSEDPEYGTRGARLLDMMQKKGYLTIVDFVSEAPEKFRRVVKAALPYIDALVINEVEAGSTFDLPTCNADGTANIDAIREAAKLFIESGVKKYVIIHYRDGAYGIGTDGSECEVPSFPADTIVGTNGAGDAFCAGVLYALHENMSLPDMLRYGSASAIFNLRSASASGGAASLTEIQDYLANH
jgi:sugar/nucleoside kinase (ribokinase family)